jgi:hypothetical protein
LITLFDSQIPDVVGPIRSTRAMDSDVVAPVGGVFAYSGGIPQSVALISHVPVAAVDETAAGPAMFRDRTKDAPHNLYWHGADLVGLGTGQPTAIPPLFPYLPADHGLRGRRGRVVHRDFDAPFRRPTPTTRRRTTGCARSAPRRSSPHVASRSRRPM